MSNSVVFLTVFRERSTGNSPPPGTIPRELDVPARVCGYKWTADEFRKIHGGITPTI
jgi:hypothetical protein